MEIDQDPESLPAFQALRVAVVGRPERSMGDAVIPAEPPRWGEVREHARTLGGAAVHLEVATALVRAGLALDGLPGLSDALSALADALESDWATMRPAADEDDEDEPWYERANLLADLAADPAFRDALLRAPLVEARGIGVFSARDMEIAEGLLDAAEEERARCRQGLIDGAFAEAELEALAATRASFESAGEAVERAAAALEREIGAGGGQALAVVGGRLAAIRSRFERGAAVRLGAGGDGPAANDAALDGTAPPTDPDGSPSADVAPRPSGDAPAAGAATGNVALADHGAVREALGAVLAYYARHEPGSPVAALVARARTLVGRGFFELVGTLCPEDGTGGDLASRLAAPRRDPLVTLLQEGFGEHLAGGVWPVPDGDGTEPPERPWSDPDAAAEPAGAAAPPAIGNRDEVVRAVDEVLAFYRAREPSSPVPLVLARVRTLVPLDFDGVLDTLRRALAADAAAAAATIEDA